jgi:metallo-beta-lactamase family protein
LRIQFWGAARTVTGSMHLLTVNGKTVLLDCGLFQGRRLEATEKNRRFPFEPGAIHSLVLSHAHIDHAGNIPHLVREGFRGPIYSTVATRDLAGYMLLDSAHIQEKDAEYLNKKRSRNGQPAAEPLYTMADAERSLKQFQGVPYHQRFEAAPGLEVEFLDAGHILGSALVVASATEGPRRARILFTGDLGRPGMPILRDPEPLPPTDALICESTYGNRLHEPEVDVKAKLREILVASHEKRGRILIPAFSVGRTQTVVYYLRQLLAAGQITPCPIYIDSPLSANITDVFRRHPECYDVETAAFLAKSGDPFGFEWITYLRTVEESMALNGRPGPFVTIAASGMCESGRVLHHLKHVAPRPENTILLVGYMAENTLGRRIQDGAKTIKVFGEEFPVRAEVRVISGLSGHADRDELLRALSVLHPPPARTFLVHGEPEQAEAFAGLLRARGFPRAEVPAPGAAVEL